MSGKDGGKKKHMKGEKHEDHGDAKHKHKEEKPKDEHKEVKDVHEGKDKAVKNGKHTAGGAKKAGKK